MSLMMMRAALIARNALPPQYQRVEYIKGSGNKWIDTLIENSDDIDIQAKLASSSVSREESAIGLSDLGFEIYKSSSDNDWKTYLRGNSESFHSPATDEEITIRYFDKKVWHDGVLAGTYQRTQPQSGGSHLIICGYSNNYLLSTAKVYSVIVRKGQTVFNGIPCRRKSDNRPGIWDTVSRTFFTTSGSGSEFSLGPDVL